MYFISTTCIFSLFLIVCTFAAPTIHSTDNVSDNVEDDGLLGWDITQLLKKPQVDGRIVGGAQASMDNFPYQLSLRYNNRHTCGAAIISPNFAITAAHCIDDTKPVSRLSLRAGSSALYSGGSVHRVAKVTVHPNFDSFAQDFDMAIIQVQQPFRFSSSVAPLRLPSAGDTLQTGTLATVSGWGSSREGLFKPALQLQYVQVPVVEPTTCAANYVGYGRITTRMLCAGYEEGQRDSCQGDSGGPLVVDRVLVGVVSWGAGCARPGLPGVYTHVAEPALRSWIAEKTGGL